MLKALHCNPSPTRESFSMRKQTTAPFLIIMLLFTVSCHDSLARNTITPAQPLSDGETLVSAGGTFSLGFFTPSTSTGRRYVGIWYHSISIQTVVWVANRQNPIIGSTGVLRLTVNGTLVINANNNSDVALWSSTPTSLTNPIATLLDTANFIVQEVNSAGDPNSFAWQSFDYPTDTLLPGMKLGWNLTSKLNRNLTSWKSDADPSIGDYTVAMDIHGDPQISLLSDSGQKWRTGPWNGIGFTAIPEMKNYSDFTFTFVNNNEAVYYSYGTSNKSLISRLVVNKTGTVQRYVWLEASDSWSVFWYAPHAQCESYSTCGAFGVCNPNASPICSCLQGFEPTSPANWALRDASSGCERKTPLDCRNGTDSFVKVSNAQLPDTSNATVDMDAGLAECRVRCLMNCSCTAYANADVRGGGSGCIIWFDELVNLGVFVDVGQDLYVRLAAADIASSSTSEQSNKRKLRVIASACLTFGLLLCAFGVWLIWSRREREEGTSSFHEMPLFDFATLVAATNDFSLGNKLGEGGFGPVYKGKTSEGQEIAVKRLSKTSLQGTDEFKNEVTLIAKLQHRNLVQLLGCCIQGEERMLVYEYMPNNSLDLFLFDKAKSSLLDWEMRYQIINGIARGLLYLHQDSRFRIVHRDLKASNILLDRNMNPKISDFGMARIFGGDESMSRTQKVVGTYGYMSPEYAMDGIFSVKSDIFSFGVLILEIISGKKNKGVYLSDPHLYLLGNAWRLWNKGKNLELIDPTIGHSFSVAEVMRCIKVGLLCVQEFPEDRPAISSVVLMLGSDDAAVPEPKQPGFVASRVYPEQFSDEQELHSVNDVTISITSGR